MTQYTLHDVFISYRRFEDEEKTNDLGTRIARAVYNHLIGKGLRVFWDDPEMEPGDFEEQLHWQIEHSPNYIFIGTEAAKRFRAEEKDFVAEEVRTALKLFHQSPNKDRIAIHVLPMMSKEEKEKAAAAGPYPDDIQKLMKLHGVELHDDLPTTKDLEGILKHVTRVNRGNMWNAGYRWYEQSRMQGARFAKLSIDRAIMPNASSQARETARLPIYAHGEQEEAQPLLTKIENIPGHLYLIGEGGIGKTTALYSIMESVYGTEVPVDSVERLRLNGQVPVFVELSRAPDTYGKLYEGGRSTFIHRAIYQQIRQDKRVKQVLGSAVRQLDEVFTIDPETAVNPIHDLFTEDSPAPEYLLLLDGLNEVSRAVIEHKDEPEMKACVVTMILQEIHQLMTECPNVRVILTSRTKEQTNWGDETTLLYMSGVGDDSIRAYLTDAGSSPERINAALNNEKLNQVLRVPLFLTLYAGLTGEDELLTQGEILHLFFHQKKEKLYSAKNRIDNVEDDVDKAAFAKQYHRLTATMQSFILDFILPEVAWRMEQGEMFHIYRDGDADEANLADIIEHVLTDESDTAVCGRYSDAFPDYLSDSDAGQDTLSVAEDMVERLGGRMRRVIDNILNSAVMTLGIMQKNGDEYGFIHHHIRDYFAAVYQINRLKLAVYLQKRRKNELARECLADWKVAPLHTEVRRFIGEALGEAHNAPVCDDDGNWHFVVPEELCERNLIKRGLDIYRGRFDGEYGYGVWNQIEIIEATRGYLCGLDLSNLDLTKCSIVMHSLGKQGCRANMDGVKVSDDFFISSRQDTRVECISFISDSKYVVIPSRHNCISRRSLQQKKVKNKTIKQVNQSSGLPNYEATIWDIKSGEMIQTCSISSSSGHDEKELKKDQCITKQGDESVVIISDTNGKGQVELKHEGKVSYAVLAPDGYSVLTISGLSYINLWEINHLEKRRIRGRSEVVYAFFDAQGKYLIVVYLDNITEVYNRRDFKLIHVINGAPATIAQFDYTIGRISIRQANKAWQEKWCSLECCLEEQDTKTMGAQSTLSSRQLIAFQNEKTISVWDIDEFYEIGKINCSEFARVVSFSPSADYILVLSGESIIESWDLRTMYMLRSYGGYHNEYVSASIGRNREYALLSTSEGTQMWRIDQNEASFRMFWGRRIDSIACINPLTNDFVTASSIDNTICLWDKQTVKKLAQLNTNSKGFKSLSFSSDGKNIIAVTSLGGILLLDSKLKGIIEEIEWYVLSADYAEYSCNDKRIMIIRGSHMYICDAKSLERIGRFDLHDPVISISISVDGNSIIALTDNHLAHIIDINEKVVKSDCVLERKVNHALYSKDGKYIFLIRYQCIDIYDSNRHFITTLEGHDDLINSVSFSDDGCYFISASKDGIAKIWDAKTLRCLDTIYNIPGLEVKGVDLRHLHPDSRLSDEVKERLYEYGAIVDERG